MNEIAFNVGLVLFGAAGGVAAWVLPFRKLKDEYDALRFLFESESNFANRLLTERNELRLFKARHTPYRVNGKFAKRDAA